MEQIPKNQEGWEPLMKIVMSIFESYNWGGGACEPISL
jgi:hypothetical protein